MKSVDISEAYTISRAGEYKVTLIATAIDAFVVPGRAKHAARNREGS
jgi:hypothetical protein